MDHPVFISLNLFDNKVHLMTQMPMTLTELVAHFGVALFFNHNVINFAGSNSIGCWFSLIHHGCWAILSGASEFELKFVTKLQPSKVHSMIASPDEFDQRSRSKFYLNWLKILAISWSYFTYRLYIWYQGISK